MGSAKNRLARLARAGDGPWSGDLAMSEGLRCAEHGTFIFLLEMSCAGRVRQGHDRLEPLVRQDVRWWWPIGYSR